MLSRRSTSKNSFNKNSFNVYPDCCSVYPHLCDINVRFYELDPYRHVNHTVFVQYFEIGRVSLFKAVGYGLEKLSDLGYQVLVTRLETSFMKPVELEDALVLETKIAKMRKVSLVWKQRILRNHVTPQSGGTVAVPGSVAAVQPISDLCGTAVMPGSVAAASAEVEIVAAQQTWTAFTDNNSNLSRIPPYLTEALQKYVTLN